MLVGGLLGANRLPEIHPLLLERFVVVIDLCIMVNVVILSPPLGISLGTYLSILHLCLHQIPLHLSHPFLHMSILILNLNVSGHHPLHLSL